MKYVKLLFYVNKVFIFNVVQKFANNSVCCALMSLPSKIALGAAVTFTVSVITYVHVSQNRARKVSIYLVSYH